jgi:hypothetical protein
MLLSVAQQIYSKCTKPKEEDVNKTLGTILTQQLTGDVVFKKFIKFDLI